MNQGQVYPVGVQEVLPGDVFDHQTSALVRVSPLVAPVMHPVQVRLHHFFVPNRLLWDGAKTGDAGNWEDFITGKDDTQPPSITVDGDYSLLDAMGVPAVTGLEISALPVRAYNMVMNEFYRDADLTQEFDLDYLYLRKCAWEKDYFTSARPWTQQGDPVSVPLGDKAPVTGLGVTTATNWNWSGSAKETGGSTVTYTNGDTADGELVVQQDGTTGYPNIYADLSAATGVDVNEIREAFALQRYAEARARYGSRYSEYLRYLGVRPGDARLQRPEYLGGGRQTISFSEVLQTAPDTGSVVGEMAGHGIAAVKSRRYRRFFEEHGIVISLMSVRPKSIYTNGLHRKWSRWTKEDYWQRELETIGQQEVLNREIYAQGTAADDQVFGYVDRYREYREHPSFVSGDFKTTLNHWHLARDFTALPVLNSAFVTCDPSKRIHAVQSEDVLWCMVYHQLRARRPVTANPAGRII